MRSLMWLAIAWLLGTGFGSGVVLLGWGWPLRLLLVGAQLAWSLLPMALLLVSLVALGYRWAHAE